MGLKEARGALAIKALFFLYYAGIGQFLSFLNVYFLDIGLSGTQIGILGTIGTLIAVVSTTVWGMLSDRFGKPRLLFLVAFTGTIAGTLALSAMQTFSSILLVVCFMSLFNRTLMPLIDSTALVLLADQRERYGTYRVWGSIGFIGGSTAAGFIYEQTGLHAMFTGFVILMTLGLLVSLRLPDQAVHLSGSAWSGLLKMIRRPEWATFAGSAFFVWLAVTGMLGFLGVTISTMGGSDRLIGLAGTIAALTEIPGMFFAARILHRFRATQLIAVGVTLYALRMFLYAVMPSPEWALAISMLNGVTYMPFWIGAVAYASEHAPENMRATTQGLLFSVMNLSNVIGALGSGWLFDRTGFSGLFTVLGISCLIALGLFGFGQVAFKRKKYYINVSSG